MVKSLRVLKFPCCYSVNLLLPSLPGFGNPEGKRESVGK